MTTLTVLAQPILVHLTAVVTHAPSLPMVAAATAPDPALVFPIVPENAAVCLMAAADRAAVPAPMVKIALTDNACRLAFV